MIPLTDVFFILIGTYTVLALIVHLLCAHQQRSSYVPIDILNCTLVVALTIIGWNYISTTYVDLDRMMQEIEIAHQQGIQFLSDTYAMNPLSIPILLIGYHTEDARTLQAIGVFLSYSFIFTFIGIAKRRYHLTFTSTIVGTDLILICFNFVTAACNIRFPIALWLLFIAIVSYRKTHPALAIILGIISILIHIGVSLVAFVYILIIILHKTIQRFILCILLLVYYNSLILLTKILLGSSNQLLYQIGDRLSYYTGINENYANTYDAIAIENGGRSTGIILLLLAGASLTIYGALIAAHSIMPAPSNLSWFTLAMLCFTIGSYSSYTIFLRYAFIVMYLVILILMYSLSQCFTLQIDQLYMSQSFNCEEKRTSLLISYWLWVIIGLILAYCLRRDLMLYFTSYITL